MDSAQPDTQQPVRRRDVAAYGLGDLGLNFYWQGSGFFLFFFYTDVVGLPNLLAGLVIAVGGVIDAVTDPAMGMLADRTRSRIGRYRAYLLFGAPALAVAYALLFLAPLGAPVALAAAVALTSHVVFRIAYTVVSIPYSSLGASLSPDARARTSLAGARMFFGAIGGLAVVHLVSCLRESVDDAQAFATAAVIAGILGAIPVIVTGLATQERGYAGAREEQTPTFATVVRIVSVNRPFAILLGAMLLITTANVLFTKTVLYLFERILNAREAGAAALSMMTLAPLVALPVWTVIFRRIDKRPGFLVGCCATNAGFLLLLFAGDGSIFLTAAACALITCSFAAFAVGFWSTLPDTIDFGHWRSGARLESTLIGLASAVQKLGIATAGVLVGFALDAVEYAAAGPMSAGSASSLRILIASAPIALITLGAIVFLNYPLSAARHGKIVKQLSRLSP